MTTFAVLLVLRQIVKIAVTGRAGHVRELVLMWIALRTALVAVSTNDRRVGAGKWEAGVTVTCKREGRCLEAFNLVARLAFVGEPLFELSGMSILVTIHARFETRAIVCGFPFFRVATFARHSRVFAGQRIQSQSVSRDVVCGFVESRNRMARSAVATIETSRELARMLVGVTVCAARARQLDAEVRCLVARPAFEPNVASKQRIFCPAVIEVCRDPVSCRLPTAGVMALRA